MRVSNGPRYYCKVLVCRAQNESLAFGFVPKLLALYYYSRLTVRGSTDDNTRVWTIALRLYLFLASAGLVINIMDELSPQYHTLKTGIDSLSGRVFGLPTRS